MNGSCAGVKGKSCMGAYKCRKFFLKTPDLWACGDPFGAKSLYYFCYFFFAN
jgi:hypothetical protein